MSTMLTLVYLLVLPLQRLATRLHSMLRRRLHRLAPPPHASRLTPAIQASPFVNKGTAEALERDAAAAAAAVAAIAAERQAQLITPDREVISPDLSQSTEAAYAEAAGVLPGTRRDGGGGVLVPAPALAALAIASPGEQTLVSEAFQTLLPGWQRRLAAAAGAPVQMDIDLEKMVWWCDTKGRLKVTTALFRGGAIARPALEVLVDAIEQCCSASETAKAAFAAAVQAIELVNTDPSASESHKTISIEDGVLVYRGPFMLGVNVGTMDRTELADFFEAQFRWQEYKLLDALQLAIGQATMDLKTLLRTDVSVVMDVEPMLARMSQPNRITLLQTLVTDFGRGYAIESKVKQVDKWLEKNATAVMRAFEKQTKILTKSGLANAAVLQKNTAEHLEMRNSPAVLRPLVHAIKDCCNACPGLRQRIGAVISEVIIELVPGKRELELRQDRASPAVAPTQFGHPVVQGGVLYYGGWFDAGGEGCWSKEELFAFLDSHFRCYEGGVTTKFQSKEAPELAKRIAAATAVPGPVEWRFRWSAIFRDDFDREQRRMVCDTMVGPLCLPILVAAIEEVCQHAPSSIQVDSVELTSPPGNVDRPVIVVNTETRTLVYSPVLVSGPGGCMSVAEIKAELRRQLSLPIPPEEAGLKAKLASVAGIFNRSAASTGAKIASSWRSWSGT